MPKTLDYRIKKLEKGPLQRFKNQNAILKKFGEDGLRLYKSATGKKTAEELVSELCLEPDFIAEAVAWMEDKGMIELITVEGEAAKPGKKEAEEEEEKEEKPRISERKLPQKKEEEEETRIPKPKSRLREIVEQEMGREKEEAAKPAPAEKEEIAPQEEKPAKKKAKPEEEETAPPEEEIKPIEAPAEGEVAPEPRGEGKTGEAPAEEEETKPEAKKAEEKEGEEAPAEEDIKPVSAGEDEKEEEKAGEVPAGEEEAPSGEEARPEEEAEGEKEEAPAEEEEIGPEAESKEEKEEEEIVPEEDEAAGLNPVERTIKEKYGDVGLKVYALIDGQKTAEEIMNETGVSEAKLIEMLEFMEKQGIIKLEHPEAKAAEEAAEEKEKFAPLAEEAPGGPAKEASPVELPSRFQAGMIKDIQVKAKIALQYGEKGSKVFEAIDGKTSDVDLSIKLGLPLYEVRDILSFLSSNRVITSRPLDRAEIAKRYGEDCFSIYKRYGREGVLLYELIGKDLGIMQMARMVTKEKDKFAEMFIFVHKVLGIDIPIDKDVIYSQLETKR